jgi:hypothetical protein
VKSVIVDTIILPLRVHAHCTAALPNFLGDCVAAIEIASKASPAMMDDEWKERIYRLFFSRSKRHW